MFSPAGGVGVSDGLLSSISLLTGGQQESSGAQVSGGHLMRQAVSCIREGVADFDLVTCALVVITPLKTHRDVIRLVSKLWLNSRAMHAVLM